MCSKASVDPKVSGKQISKAELLLKCLPSKLLVGLYVCTPYVPTYIRMKIDQTHECQKLETGSSTIKSSSKFCQVKAGRFRREINPFLNM